MVHCISKNCGVLPTIDKHDMHCEYHSQISLSSINNDLTDKWQISYPSMRQSSSTDTTLFAQFIFIKITTTIDTSLLIEPLIRESCDYSFQTDLAFKSSPSTDNTQMTYTVILPSCNKEAIELCTYYIVIEASNQLINDGNNNKNITKASYELAASLGILLQFQQKYSYSTDNDIDTDTDNNDMDSNHNDDIAMETLNKLNKENDNDIINVTCIYEQFYGLKASFSDFPIGIIIQPEFIDTDASFIINQYTSSPNTQTNGKQINKLKGDAESESYGVPSAGYISSEDYILLNIIFYHFDSSKNNENEQGQINKILPNIKYIIYSQSNISYIQVSVINSGGWFLLLILVFLILIAMCRKHCCLRDNNHRLSYNDILENIQLQNPLFLNMNNDAAASSNADDQKSIGVNSDELNNVSVIEIFRKKALSKMSLNYKKYKKKERGKYKYKACCICLYDYKNGEKIRKLKCNHYFHQKCIDIWFQKNIHCPLCKQSVINAQILSKRSNTTNSTHSTNSDISTTATTTDSNNNDENDEDEEEEEEEEYESSSTESKHDDDDDDNDDIDDIKQDNFNNTYSLSDSHCIYNSKQHENHHKVMDDMYISRYSNPNIITRHRNRNSQSYSNSHHSYHSSHSSEIMVNNNNNNGNTPKHHSHLITMTTTTNTTADVSISSSNNDLSETIEDNNKSFIPLSPKINLYFENKFISSSPSNPKRE